MDSRNNWKNPALYKTRFCDFWTDRRNCKYGNRCWYAHGSHELRTVPHLEDNLAAKTVSLSEVVELLPPSKDRSRAMDYANEVVNDAQADIFQRVTVPFLNSLAFQMMSNQENEADDENLMKNKNQAKNEAQILMKNKDQSRNEVRILIKNEGKSQSRNEAQNWPRNWEQSRNEAQNWSRNQEQSRIEAQNWSKNWEQSRNEAQYQAINKVQNLMKNEVQDRSRNDAQNQSSNEAKTLNDLMPMLMQVLQKKPFVPDQRAFPLNQDHSIFSQQTHRPPLNDSLSWASSPSTSSNSSTRFPSFDSWSNTSFNSSSPLDLNDEGNEEKCPFEPIHSNMDRFCNSLFM